MKKPTSTVPPRPVQDSIHDALEGPPESRSRVETMMPCPACRRCPTCAGLHMVSATVYAAWQAAHDEEE